MSDIPHRCYAPTPRDRLGGYQADEFMGHDFGPMPWKGPPRRWRCAGCNAVYPLGTTECPRCSTTTHQQAQGRQPC